MTRIKKENRTYGANVNSLMTLPGLTKKKQKQ